jgi:asparagine synthase (glutamine-hydrolysing)
MSGIAGIARADGRSVDRELLLRMARALSFRGPDAQHIWTAGAVGLAHAGHWIRGDDTRTAQPESIGAGTWITADVRLDARQELVAELRAQGRDASVSRSDSQLLLHAYEIWGEECLAHLIGDFSFALWDARRRQLFCACDHFGIRQFYFSKTDSCFAFSNTLDCVRLHPQVSDRLNDAAIGDFLLFGMNYEEDTTSFADIQHLPRAHWLRWSADGMETKEYWRPPTNGEIRYKRRAEYVEHFSELLGKAVADRIRADSVGVLLSGGMDSSSVTAICKETASRQGQPLELHAFTATSEGPDDKDGPAAKRVADALRIPMHCWNVSSTALFEDWGPDGVRWPEPVDSPLASGMLGQFREIATHTAVLLSGEGCDNLMVCKPEEEFRRLWRQGRRAQAVLEATKHGIARFSSPDGLRGPLRRLFGLSPSPARPSFPEWISPELVERLDLNERWSNPFPKIRWDEHLRHPKAYGSLFYPHWRRMFETQDPAYTRAVVEVRYPFLDVRLVRFLLAIPALPWFFRKFLLREAMRRRLPEATRRRPKTPAQDVLETALRGQQEFVISKPSMTAGLGGYVRTDCTLNRPGEGFAKTGGLNLRPLCLNFWMEGLSEGLSVAPHLSVGAT